MTMDEDNEWMLEMTNAFDCLLSYRMGMMMMARIDEDRS